MFWYDVRKSSIKHVLWCSLMLLKPGTNDLISQGIIHFKTLHHRNTWWIMIKKRIHENYLTPLIKQNILHSNCHEQRNLPYVSIYIYIFIYICMYIYNSFKYIYIYIEAPRSLAPAEGIMGPLAPLGFGAFGPKTLKSFQSSSKYKY